QPEETTSMSTQAESPTAHAAMKPTLHARVKMVWAPAMQAALIVALLVLGKSGPVFAQQVTVTCSSKIGERSHCPADTSQGVALARSTGESACLLGKTWGYDDTGIWVSDGCSASFVVGKKLEGAVTEREEKGKMPFYQPNIGFLLFSGEKGEIWMRLFSYARYL